MISDALAYVGLGLDAGAALWLAFLPTWAASRVDAAVNPPNPPGLLDRRDRGPGRALAKRLGLKAPPLLPHSPERAHWVRDAEASLTRRWTYRLGVLMAVGFVLQIAARAPA